MASFAKSKVQRFPQPKENAPAPGQYEIKAAWNNGSGALVPKERRFGDNINGEVSGEATPAVLVKSDNGPAPKKQNGASMCKMEAELKSVRVELADKKKEVSWIC